MTTIAKFAVACSLAMLPFTASAQTDDAAYCAALTKMYRNTASFHQTASTAVPVAVAKCAAGEPAAGIPVLEQALRNLGAKLPSRA